MKKEYKYPIILQDNDRSHKQKPLVEHFKENEIELWVHPPYSLDLNLCDYDCFGPLKRALRGVQYDDWFHSEGRLRKAISEGMEKGLFRGVQRLPQRWQGVINKEGQYI